MAIVVGTCVKDPQETRLFKMDWSAAIGTNQIVTSSWEVPSGLTLTANGIVEGNTKTYIVVSGGTANGTYTLTNTIALNGNGIILQRSGKLDVREY